MTRNHANSQASINPISSNPSGKYGFAELVCVVAALPAQATLDECGLRAAPYGHLYMHLFWRSKTLNRFLSNNHREGKTHEADLVSR